MHPADQITDDRKLTIWINENNQIMVTGPLGNRAMCWALLKEAELIIANFKPSPIVQPTSGDVKRMVN